MVGKNSVASLPIRDKTMVKRQLNLTSQYFPFNLADYRLKHKKWRMKIAFMCLWTVANNMAK